MSIMSHRNLKPCKRGLLKLNIFQAFLRTERIQITYRHSGSGMHGNGLQVSGRMNCVELEESHVISSFTFTETESETVSVSQYWDGQVTVLRSISQSTQ